ncbi:hypothetical protein [Mesorhizobium sp. ES1-3]|uniref:hypothetical protein n=1 Tax=Mesorhizobium sp. ES1-3 TaxID=2876628 RepID=UPI001CC93A6A|nr:hypothetical protein [Mesorhizobium sp. ES1-3]MBZ9674047.1 hypothetical protein [Mesorhizobium sp. ES1-3]
MAKEEKYILIGIGVSLPISVILFIIELKYSQIRIYFLCAAVFSSFLIFLFIFQISAKKLYGIGYLEGIYKNIKKKY